MKRRLLILASILTVASGLTACADDESSAPEPSIAEGDDALIRTPMSPIVAPLAPIAWEGTVGTWPIAVWSNQPLSWLAFDIPGATRLRLSLATIDGAPLRGLAPRPISSRLLGTLTAGPWLGGLMPSYGLLPQLDGLSGLDSYAGYAGPGFAYGLDYMPDGVIGLGTIGLGAILPAPIATPPAGARALPPVPAASATTAAAMFSPAVTANARVIRTMPTIVGLTPFVVNVRFDAASLAADTIATMNVFSAMNAANAATIQSVVLPILGVPVTPGALPLLDAPVAPSLL